MFVGPVNRQLARLFAGESSAASNISDDRAGGSENVRSIDDGPTPAEADATRALRSAIFGIVFPPLLLYAAYLAIKSIGQHPSRAAKWKFNATLAICLALFILSAVLWQAFRHGSR